MPQTIELRDGHFGLFGYGSLLLKSSMERTLARSYDGDPIVCRVDGWRRTWNAITRTIATSIWKTGGSTTRRASST